MKTAISLPDDLFEHADSYAQRARLSRSELCARALRDYLDRHDAEQVREQLDAVCTEVDTHLDPALQRAALRVVERDEW